MGRTDSRGRALLLLIVFAVTGAALLARLAYWQVGQRDRLADEALEQTTFRETTPSRRGDIYDRTGVVVLATTIARARLVATPSEMSPTRRVEVADRLVTLLDLSGEAADDLKARVTSDRKYVVLAHGLDQATGDRISAAIASKEIGAVALEPEAVRVYPQPGGGPHTTLAAKVLGFVNRDGVGQYGVEQFYQDQLGGRPKVVQAQRDLAAADATIVKDPGAPGEDLRLTIDAGLQLAVEQEVLAAWAADRAKSVSAVVMDPATGEIYAEASYPSYDGNDFAAIAASDPDRFIDPIVSSVYEPGSVFKMFTVVAAMEKQQVTTKTRVRDTGILLLDHGHSHVDDADHHAMGWMTFEDAIAWSRNVVAAKTALGLDRNVRKASAILHSTWTKFGFGRPTGVDLAGEVSGLVRDPALHTWREIDLANGAFGQGVAVTPLQLASAYATMVNGGLHVQPHVVKAVGPSETASEAAAGGERVIEKGLSATLIGMMHHVVATVPFYRDRTLIRGYDVGGKTGTAQIWDTKANHGRGGWKHNIFNYSFAGYIARETGRPDLVVAIRIEEGKPTIAKLGQLEMPVMSFELFRRIAHDAITTPDLLPTGAVTPGSETATR